MDLARSVQERYEDALAHLINEALRRGAPRRLAMAGGCAMNSVANGRIYERTDVDAVYVQPGAGDAGGALGAALCAHVDAGGAVDGLVMERADHGPGFSDEQVKRAIAGCAREIAQAGCQHRIAIGDAQLCSDTAAAIARGEVVGWFQGRMEWGPRALGQRSILADPRRADMKQVLNVKIKRRESFRPFAPSVLREAVGEWFETDDDVPFMMKVFRIRPGRRPRIPAVTHVDGTGRLQSVSARSQPLYHALIRCFQALTGVPMVLNTSFNENEPIVCTPEQAIDCFLRTRMDRLVIGRHVLSRGTGIP
jgi:carbamoyltransferase